MSNYKGIILDPGHGGIDLGFYNEEKYEKDFDLKLAKYMYDRLKYLCFPVYMTRTDDYMISNYDRFEYIDNVIEEVGGKVLVFSIQIDNDNAEEIKVIYSVNSKEEDNKDLYNMLNDITVVMTKTLPTDDSKDYYAIQRLKPDNAEVIVIEFGYNNVNDSDEQIKSYADQIVDILINMFDDTDFCSYEKYVVKKGDNLYDLANHYDTTVEELKKINKLGTDFLDDGEMLNVPKLKNNFYVVMKGDSLYSIAKKFNTTVDKIKDINNLITNKLVVNQKLLIPD